MDPRLISLIPARAVEPASYLELALRAVTANAQAITRLNLNFMALHGTELVALYPAAVDFMPRYLKAYLSERLQTQASLSAEPGCPVVFRDFALSEISTQVKDHGYSELIIQIKEG
ncbi:hypothetical protein DV532_27475 (plasmid) [Pseudomonas sp. Leaf58]|uniref:hypothetical protein n=1 Tax=Pseudomonas sp. Leaf58 TaxID=1736226 RepID=UPI0006FAC594|nr:hypothetical protein [Pseudomonas sp. Leaf58]AYG48024.1 hypothetical protein DV532_27475 [Pseudomonas sp. Leaf58]KQN62419.1 hypothetical protein ASF02_09725 [Pseudomonas sp. Leaf58]